MIVLAFLCLVASTAFADDFQPMTRVLHRENDETSYYPVPTTLEEATGKSWVESELPPNAQTYFDDTVKLYTRPEAKTLGIYVDQDGIVVGYNFALDESHYKNVKTDFAKAGFTSWETTVNGTTVTYQSTLAKYVCSGEGSERVCNSAQYPGINGELTEISFDISKDPQFTKEKCFDTAGVHYLQGVNSATTFEDFDPRYLLTNCDGQIIGAGYLIIAERAVEKSWWWTVRWGASDLQDALNDPPAWLTEYASSIGIEGLEFWLIDNPQEFQCSACA